MPGNIQDNSIASSTSRRQILGLFAAVFITLAGADSSSAQEKVIAVSFPNYSKQAPVITTLEETKRRGQELGFTVVLDDPGSDLNKQINTIKTWISQKVAVIIAVALNPEVFEGVAKQARDAGIIWLTRNCRTRTQQLASTSTNLPSS
jgi:ribose transport system substrate-binding protein